MNPHMAKSVNELNRLWENVDALVNNKTITETVITGKLLYLDAEKKYGEGDEKSAYVLYGRYLNVLFRLQKRSDYQIHKNYIIQILGGNFEQERVMYRLTDLKTILSQQFDELNHPREE